MIVGRNGRQGHSDGASGLTGPSGGRVALHGVSSPTHVASETTVRPSHPLRKVTDFYPVGVLSDEVAVAGLSCGHLNFDLTEYAEWAECGWCK